MLHQKKSTSVERLFRFSKIQYKIFFMTMISVQFINTLISSGSLFNIIDFVSYFMTFCWSYDPIKVISVFIRLCYWHILQTLPPGTLNPVNSLYPAFLMLCFSLILPSWGTRGHVTYLKLPRDGPRVKWVLTHYHSWVWSFGFYPGEPIIQWFIGACSHVVRCSFTFLNKIYMIQSWWQTFLNCLFAVQI